MEFRTDDYVQEEKKEFVSKYLPFGIHEAKVKSIELVTSSKGTKGMRLTFEGKPEEALNDEGKTAQADFYLSEAAWPHTKRRLSEIAEALGVKDQLNAIKTDSEEDYTAKVAKVFTGKTARWKFAGKEVAGKQAEDGTTKKNWFKAELAFFNFVEAISQSPSKLIFDQASDLIRLPKAEVETKESNDLPF